MCRRPSRSLKRTVSALMRFSSVRYLSRSSWILCGATRSRRCFLAFRFISSNSSYEIERKFRSSLDMLLLDTEIERSPEVSSTGWEYRIGYRVERSGTNKKGLCLRLQGFILVEKDCSGNGALRRRWNLVFWVRSMK